MHRMLFGSDGYLTYFSRLSLVLHMFLLEQLQLHQVEYQLLEQLNLHQEEHQLLEQLRLHQEEQQLLEQLHLHQEKYQLLEQLHLHQEEHLVLVLRAVELQPVGPHLVDHHHQPVEPLQLVVHLLVGQLMQSPRVPHQILEQATHQLQTSLVSHHVQGIRHLRRQGTHLLQTLE